MIIILLSHMFCGSGVQEGLSWLMPIMGSLMQVPLRLDPEEGRGDAEPKLGLGIVLASRSLESSQVVTCVR